jgi:glycosidase
VNDGWLCAQNRIGLSTDGNNGGWVLAGSFAGAGYPDWSTTGIPMAPQGGGIYAVTLHLPMGGGPDWIGDPLNNTYGWKTVVPGTWDSICEDTRATNTANAYLVVSAGKEDWTFYVDAYTGVVKTVPEPAIAVDFTDYVIFASHWMDGNCTDPNWCDGADLNKSGSVDWYDLAEFVEYWLLDNSQNHIWWDEVLHDSRDADYRSPGWATTSPYRTGAVPSGTTVTLGLRTPANVLTACYVNGRDNDASIEVITEMSIVSSDETYDYWQAAITFNKAVDYYYAFRLVEGTTEYWYQDDASKDGGVGAISENHNSSRDYAIVWYEADFTTPPWHKNAVIYQIMLDSFYNGDIANDPVGDGASGDVCWWEWDWSGSGSNSGRSWVYKKPWGEVRTYYDRGFYGGDFEGVRQKIAYLTDLGINAIYFNPWMESPDYHGYTWNNHYSVHPYYGVIGSRVAFDADTDIVINDTAGSLALFDNMISNLDANGIKVISDMVLNHCGAQSKYFQRFEHVDPNWGVYDYYPDVNGAYEYQTSYWYDWFKFDNWNHDYEGWASFDNLPKIQYENTTALNDLVSGGNSVFNFWDSHGVEGYRLDVTPDFADGNNSRTVNRAIRNKVKALNSNGAIIAEVWGKANQWLAGDMCDGNMNYRFRNAVIDWIKANITTDVLNRSLLAIQEDYPVEAQYACWAILGSHDTQRIKTVLGSEDKQKLAAIIQFAHIGPPVIWSGDEVGMTGGTDPRNRTSMDWSLATPSNDLLTFYKTLINTRNTYAQLREGWIATLLVDTDVYAYGREYGSGASAADAVIVLNRSGSSVPVTIDVSQLPGLAVGNILVDRLTGTPYTVSGGLTISLTVPALNGAILTTSLPL